VNPVLFQTLTENVTRQRPRFKIQQWYLRVLCLYERPVPVTRYKGTLRFAPVYGRNHTVLIWIETKCTRVSTCAFSWVQLQCSDMNAVFLYVVFIVPRALKQIACTHVSTKYVCRCRRQTLDNGEPLTFIVHYHRRIKHTETGNHSMILKCC
jgi:hypothetical protein